MRRRQWSRSCSEKKRRKRKLRLDRLSWLQALNREPGTRCKIRNAMSLLFNHGRRHDLCDRNPIQWVRRGAKRRTAPDILTRDEVQGLLANLRFREPTLVLLAVTTGLRRSE